MLEQCFVDHPIDGRTVMIIRGQAGYHEAPAEYREYSAEVLNERWGITEEQAQKMLIGSMFGWDAPGAQGIDVCELTVNVTVKRGIIGQEN